MTNLSKISKKKLHLSSTSYLLPQINEWNNLKKNFQLNFMEFNQFKINDKKIFSEIIVIFLEDIIDEFIITKKQFDTNKQKLKSFLSILNTKFIKESTNHIVCHSFYNFKNYVNFSKEKNLNLLLQEYFDEELYKISKKNKNLYVINLNHIFCHYGFSKVFDLRNFYLARCRLSQYGIKIFQEVIMNVLERIIKSNKKLLLLDCDNTLWGGVVSEDGLEKIQLGQDGLGKAHQDFQKSIKFLKDKGILIGLVSKNVKDDVLEVLKKNKNMIIREKDITTYKINWKTKSSNIQEISNELMLGLDSFVFWDDNPVERQNVRKILKDVDVIEPDEDVSNWAKQLIEYQGFTKIKTTKEDLKKTEQYKKRSSFLENKKVHKSEIDYLKSIKIKPKIVKIDKFNIDRAIQIIQKTNQFNLSNIKYSFEELKEIDKKEKVFMVNLKDIYGDHGLISLVIIKSLNKKILIIDTFILSCRILGRYTENWIMQKIINLAKKNKNEEILIKFSKTKKNVPGEDFLKSLKPKKLDKKYILKKYKAKSNDINYNDNSDFYSIKTNQIIKNSNLYD